eukprot:1282912-Prymnesium_polylepis.1
MSRTYVIRAVHPHPHFKCAGVCARLVIGSQQALLPNRRSSGRTAEESHVPGMPDVWARAPTSNCNKVESSWASSP